MFWQLQLLSLGLCLEAVSAQQVAYGQCGGSGWTGPTTCVSGYTCTFSSEWYSQCIPGGSATTTTTLKTTTKAVTSSKTTTKSATPTATAASGSVSDITFCLAGDSTTASGGGWGDALCQQTLLSGVTCKNFGHNGATTSSFISDTSSLSWTNTLACVKSAKNKAKTFVTIQFGHNDQKQGDGFKPTYLANLKRMANDVLALGAKPIFVTPLSRRNYDSSTNKIKDTLEPWAVVVRQAASETNQPYIELLQSSITYLNKIGKTSAAKLNLEADDNTHLNANGKVVFGRMVADLIKAKGTVSPDPFKADATLSSQIANGVPTF